MIIQVDFLFARLCRDVSNWYTNHYQGLDLDRKKNIHLMLMQERYDRREFSNDPAELEMQIVAFLTKVQQEMNGFEL